MNENLKNIQVNNFKHIYTSIADMVIEISFKDIEEDLYFQLDNKYREHQELFNAKGKKTNDELKELFNSTKDLKELLCVILKSSKIKKAYKDKIKITDEGNKLINNITKTTKYVDYNILLKENIKNTYYHDVILMHLSPKHFENYKETFRFVDTNKFLNIINSEFMVFVNIAFLILFNIGQTKLKLIKKL